MKLGYKVKDIISKNSRPRVFFISHDDDHEEYLSRVIAMLHEQSDCMVYFRETEDLHRSISAEELGQTLSDMQLVVIPVTQKLLREPSEAMSKVIPYALDHNIPVLPILMEKDPAGRYSKLFGNLQYLDADDSDKTAEPFEKKLAAYLSEMLVSPETIKRIKDAFDACIFLSYRKKDRAMARELMRMIHRDPGYRDISFWYDEFLVPGEDFNDGILQALDDADLFAMVVTPQLLEDPNYVMTNEYPAARDAGKTIFPVEMEQTDSSELERCYQGIPRKVTAAEDETWERELNEKLQRFASQTGKDDPQHMFLIGLAYLDGINMEVDTEKARVLITEAADAGLEEAMRKLSSMYFHGKGVPKSLVTSTQWQKKLRDSLENRYYADKTDDLLEELYKEENQLANRYFRMDDDKQALYAASCLRGYAEEKVRRGMAGGRHDLAFCTTKMGTMFHTFDDYYQTKKYYEDALEVYEELLREEPSDVIKRECSLVYGYLGLLYKSRSMTEEALDSYTHAEEIMLSISDDSYRKATARHLLSQYRSHAEVLAKAGRNEEALEMFAKASEVADTIPAEEADFKLKTQLAFLYESLDDLYYDIGRKEEAREYRRKRIKVLDLQIEEAREAGMRYADLYYWKGVCHGRLGEADEARRCYHMSLEAHEDDPDIAPVYQDHIHAYRELAYLESRMGNTELAEEYRKEELALARKLAELTGSRKHRDLLADCLVKNAYEGDTDPDMLEEALFVRQQAYMMGRDLDFKAKKEHLRRRIDDLYREHPELRRWRVALLKNREDELQLDKEALLSRGFVVMDQMDFPGYNTHEFVDEIAPDIMLVGLGKPSGNVAEKIRKWKKDNWLDRCKTPLLIAADAEYEAALEKGAKEENYGYIIRPYTDEQLICTVRKIVEK
ncbi:MAG: TIR domain-containing protein [Mogibacterium sp.]|nr:TIR domain-containing protein [Mogibacterium sp.]